AAPPGAAGRGRGERGGEAGGRAGRGPGQEMALEVLRREHGGRLGSSPALAARRHVEVRMMPLPSQSTRSTGPEKPGSAPHRTGVGDPREDHMRMPRVASVMITASIFSAGLALAATAATVTCKDGTTGPGGRGACRGHGGIDKSASSGSTTSAPSAAAEPSEATTVTCKDGTSSKGGRGACRGHGGIANARATERAPEAEGAATTVTCKDGTTSKGGRGACRGHGGIAKAGET